MHKLQKIKKATTGLIGILAGVMLGSMIGAGFLFGLLPLLGLPNQSIFSPQNDNHLFGSALPSLTTIQQNSLTPISNPSIPKLKTIKRMNVLATAYSSSPAQTDDEPFITAAGTFVRDGIVANNYLPMGTKIRIPQLFGEKIFVIEDRMHWRKGNDHIDIWFPEYSQAKDFGVKKTYIEVLEG